MITRMSKWIRFAVGAGTVFDVKSNCIQFLFHLGCEIKVHILFYSSAGNGETAGANGKLDQEKDIKKEHLHGQKVRGFL